MTINTVAQGNISLTAIDLEINGTNGTNKSLRALSAAAGKSSPDGLSEFGGYSHITNHSTTLLPDFWTSGGSDQYDPIFYYSGYATGGNASVDGVGDLLGNASFPDSGTINFGGLTRNANDIEIKYAYFWGAAGTNSTTFLLTLNDSSSDHGTSWSNAGWTNIEFYLGQTNTSGSPDLTLARTAASSYFTDNTSSTTMSYMWSTDKPYSSYFGNSTNPSTNGYSTINITGLSS